MSDEVSPTTMTTPSEPPNGRHGSAVPAVLEVRARPHARYQRRLKAGEALAAGPTNAAVKDAVRTGMKQLARQPLRGAVAIRIVDRSEGRVIATDIVKVGDEVREILAHLDARLEHADLGQLAASVKDDLGMRRTEVERRIPGTAIAIVEAAAPRPRMAERGHDDGGLRPSDHPLMGRDHSQHAELRRNTVVRPAFELQHQLEIARCRHRVEDADRWIAARDEAVGVGQPEMTNRRERQFMPPRRASTRRRTWWSASMPPSTMNESAGAPPNIALALGSLTQRSASAVSGYRMWRAL